MNEGSASGAARPGTTGDGAGIGRAAAAVALALAALLPLAQPAASPCAAAEPPAAVHVRYVSADYVYLDGGTADGLAVGDTVTVDRAGTAVATLQIVYAAEHSSSCRLLFVSGAVQAGDAARPRRVGAPPPPAEGAPGYVPAPAGPAGAVATFPGTSAAAGGQPVGTPPAAPLAEISGYAALAWYHYSDRSSSGLDYDQPSLRLHLKARRLWGRPLTFEVRGRAQHDHRARSFSEGVPSSEWSNRVYSFSLAYDDPDAAVTWQAGRITSSAIAATGPVDGLLVETRLSGALRGGAFGGTLPDWRDSSPRSSMQKYGAYLRATRGDYGSRRWALAAAGTAEYHGSLVSRQYLYLQSEWQSGRRWSLYEGAELDLNNGWRRAGAPGSVSLTNLYLTGNWRPSSDASFGLTYDSRRNYRTWDNRSLADSIFDDALRQGLRALASARLGGRWQAFGNGGWRGKQGGGEDTWSWSAGLTRDDVFATGVRLTAQASGFDGPHTSGLNPSLLLHKYFALGHSLGLSGGSYRYRFDGIATRRINSWLRAEGTGRLTPHLYLTGQYEYDWGDDVQGLRLLAELGVNF